MVLSGFTAVTIAIGAKYQALAELTVPAFETATGLTTRVVRKGSDPFASKMAIMGAATGPMIFWDVDCAFLRPWLAAPDASGIGMALHGDGACEQFGTPHYNTGVVLCGPLHAGVFRRALEIYNDGVASTVRSMHDQGPINIAARELGAPVAVLPRTHNFQFTRKSDHRAAESAVVVHACGAMGKLKRLRKFLPTPTITNKGEDACL